MIPIPVARVDRTPFFEPWRGEDYKKRQERRDEGDGSCCESLWHIMGESHPGDRSDYKPGFTIGIVEDLAYNGYRFFDTVLAIATGRDIGSDSRADQWSRFAFSNFVQDMLVDGRRRPLRHEWLGGREAFYGQLAITRPRQLLVVGKEQWDQWLPNDGGVALPTIPMWDGDGEITDLWLYAVQLDDRVHFTVATWIYHPSSRGQLDPIYARRKVKTVDMAICNIMSAIEEKDEGWFINPWK